MASTSSIEKSPNITGISHYLFCERISTMTISDLYTVTRNWKFIERAWRMIWFFDSTHPSFRSGPPWYNWCLVNFGDNTGSSYPGNMFRGSGVTDENKVPCKILAIFEVESKDGMGTTKILVQRCQGSNHKNDSCLTESWQKYSILKTRRIPAMDKNRNILPSGQGKLIKVRYQNWKS